MLIVVCNRKNWQGSMSMRFRPLHFLFLFVIALGPGGCGDDSDPAAANQTADAAIDVSSDANADLAQGNDTGSSAVDASSEGAPDAEDVGTGADRTAMDEAASTDGGDAGT